jgi:hypothetical protein
MVAPPIALIGAARATFFDAAESVHEAAEALPQ